jgi:hypothetical protein
MMLGWLVRRVRYSLFEIRQVWIVRDGQVWHSHYANGAWMVAISLMGVANLIPRGLSPRYVRHDNDQYVALWWRD